MIDPQLFIGGAFAALCLLGLRFDHWIVTKTRKGQWFNRRFGLTKSIWLCRIALLAGFGFGVCVVAHWINPLN